MAFERHRDTKRLRYRGARGRFRRPPSLESAGVIWICDCGGINVTESTPGRCGHCGAKRADRQEDEKT